LTPVFLRAAASPRLEVNCRNDSFDNSPSFLHVFQAEYIYALVFVDVFNLDELARRVKAISVSG